MLNYIKGDIILKAAMVTTYWKGSNGGGIRTYVTNLVDELKRTNNISINVIFREGYDEENYRIDGNKIFFSAKSILMLSKLKPAAIYSQGTWYCLLSGVIYKLLCPTTKLIHTFHTEPSSTLTYWKRTFFQILLNRCDYITFVSKSLINKNEELLGLQFPNAIITHAGVPMMKECSQTEIKEFRKKYGLNDKSIVLLAIGLTALRHKADGGKLLIKAVKELNFKNKNVFLFLTREGTYSNELKEYARTEYISENVIFTGTIENPFVALHVCDLYVHTPLGEGGVSIALLEAMASGKPIVATSVGGIPEAIEDGVNGLLVKPDYVQIAEKIEYLLENKDVARLLGENAKITAQEKFSWKAVADKFIEMSQ